jgi:hypothetical protein
LNRDRGRISVSIGRNASYDFLHAMNDLLFCSRPVEMDEARRRGPDGEGQPTHGPIIHRIKRSFDGVADGLIFVLTHRRHRIHDDKKRKQQDGKIDVGHESPFVIFMFRAFVRLLGSWRIGPCSSLIIG